MRTGAQHTSSGLTHARGGGGGSAASLCSIHNSMTLRQVSERVKDEHRRAAKWPTRP